MELVTIEEGRIIYLVQVHRPSGQLYWPDAAKGLVERYGFIKAPSLEDLSSRRDYLMFGMGKFLGAAIAELRIYNDGMIVESQSDTKLLDGFVEDLFTWAASEFGITPTLTAKPEKYYETTLVVRASTDLARSLAALDHITAVANKLIGKLPAPAREYRASGFILDCDAHSEGGRRKTRKFVVDRRVGIPFDENVFFSEAPLTTADHLTFLEEVERAGG